ncbi:MAG: trehalose-6-phosphate synthase [Corynebacterium sp.]|nr:trehalose-6-phosphate synthase [Corynebacterium sp.]
MTLADSSAHDNSFVVVANRLPVDLHLGPSGEREWVPSPGGLVAALSPVLEKHSGCWVGWPGEINESPEPFRTEGGVLLHPVKLTDSDYEQFYEGFSNATMWPLYHNLIVTPQFNRSWWDTYRDVNLRFATEVAHVAAPNATVWVQDYQLQLLPGILRQMRPDLTIGFFLHIPFPPPEIYRQLPWRDEMLRGLLGADLIGFHLESNVANFLNLARTHGIEVAGEVSTRSAGATITAPDGRCVGVGAFPISISTQALSAPNAADAAKVAALREDMGNPKTVLLGVDRLDYTKGILQRLIAFEELLETQALDPAEVVLVQLATPSRERIDHYRRIRSQVEEAVGRINGRFASIGRPVVHYQHRSVSKDTLRLYYKMADVMVVTPFRDGMNLVAKEYIATRTDYSGALVLSEFAGAADELPQANLCNPYDIESIKKAIFQAAAGLHDNPEMMRERMKALHRQVMEHDVDLWASAFLNALEKTRSLAQE